MKIDHLFELFDSKQISSKIDYKIAECIIQAERDWNSPINDLDEFINILENEIGGETSEENLRVLLEKYNNQLTNKTAWKSESISYLLDIFKNSGYSNLKLVFSDLSEKFEKKSNITKREIFESKGFPTIKLHENYFEVKAIDHWEFRKFDYLELEELKLVDPKNKWWYRLYISTSMAGSIFSKNDPIKLVVNKKNGGEWEYKTSSKTNIQFDNTIRKVNQRIKSTIGNNV